MARRRKNTGNPVNPEDFLFAEKKKEPVRPKPQRTQEELDGAKPILRDVWKPGPKSQILWFYVPLFDQDILVISNNLIPYIGEVREMWPEMSVWTEEEIHRIKDVNLSKQDLYSLNMTKFTFSGLISQAKATK